MTPPTLGSLDLSPALSRRELLAAPVATALEVLPEVAERTWVAPIDPELADTAAFCAAYGVGQEVSANCVVVRGSRAGEVRTAACLVLATTRADVNGTVRKRLDVRKASFAPVAEATSETGMAYGGITPLGLPLDWPVLLDPAVEALPWAVVGSGVRGSKLTIPGATLASLPRAEVVPSLSRPAPAP